MSSPMSMKHKRRNSPPQPSSITLGVAVCFFMIGVLFSFIIRSGNEALGFLSKSNHSKESQHLLDAWRTSPETCDQWLSIQKSHRSYIDTYIIGSQKGATSQLCKHFHMLGVREPGMRKEWHFFNKLDEHSNLVKYRTVADSLPILHIPSLRLKHYQTGFPDSNVSMHEIPTVDSAALENRSLIIDSTVEYLHSDRSAYLASALTPSAKIILTIRDPLDRALSQYNMVKRVNNKAARANGKPDEPATASEFHRKVRDEIKQLAACGYNAETGYYNGRTAELVQCMFAARGTTLPDDMLYVTRGLYHLHINAWRAYFPDHRLHIISFQEIMLGRPEVYRNLSKFLCMRPFPQALLDEFEGNATTLSFGQLAARQGLKSAGFDSFDGNDRYLAEMLPETRSMLLNFYAAADEHLEQLLGSKMY